MCVPFFCRSTMAKVLEFRCFESWTAFVSVWRQKLVDQG